LLYRRAAAELAIGLDGSFVIGDTREDLEAAQTLGCRGILAAARWIVASMKRPNIGLEPTRQTVG
jgi:histidinol phosphatase-like enzyme